MMIHAANARRENEPTMRCLVMHAFCVRLRCDMHVIGAGHLMIGIYVDLQHCAKQNALKTLQVNMVICLGFSKRRVRL